MEITREVLWFLVGLAVTLLAAALVTTYTKVLAIIAGVIGLVVMLAVLLD